MNKLTKLLSVFVIAGAVGTGVSFAAGCGHKHSFSEDWTSDETSHWHAATCEHTDKADLDGHHDVDNNLLCDECGYDLATHVTGVTLNTTSKTLKIGGAAADAEFQLTATVLPANASIKTYTWSSSNPSVADVDAQGKVTAKAVGKADITVTTTDGARTAKCAITVEDDSLPTPETVTIELGNNNLALKKDETAEVELKLDSTYVGKKLYVFSYDTVELTTAENAEASTGVLVTYAEGLKVTVKYTGEEDGEVTVYVCPVLAMGETEVTAAVGANLFAVIADEVTEVTATVQGESDGKIGFRGMLSVELLTEQTFTAENGIAIISLFNNGDASATVTLNIAEEEEEKPEFNGTTLELDTAAEFSADAWTYSLFKIDLKAGSYKLNFTDCQVSDLDIVVGLSFNGYGEVEEVIDAENGVYTLTQDKTVYIGLIISLDADPTIEEVSGKITVSEDEGEQPDPETFTVTYVINGHGEQPNPVEDVTALPETLPELTEEGWTFDGWYTDAEFNTAATAGAAITEDTTLYAKWTKKTVAVTGISLSKNEVTLKVGASTTIKATIAPANATNQNRTRTSSNPEVATIDENGTIKAVGVGEATITVKTEDGGFEAKCVVTVEPATIAVTGVTLDSETLELEVGDTEDLVATVAPANATNKNLTFTSSDTTVATMDGDTITALKAGTTTITVTTADGNYTATCAVTVKERTSATVAVTGISLDKTTLNLKVGDTEKITATITPASATNKSRTRVSSNTSVATISTDGTVTAVGEGTATITVKTVDGGYEAICTVTVTPATIAVTGVALDVETLNLTVGDTYEFEATITPDDADNQSVRYTSSDDTVAKMVGNKLTALKAGTATITVTTDDGNYTATCAVTVAPETFSVTYNIKGHGTQPAKSTEVTALPATLPTLTETGWTFDGWYTDEAFNTPAEAGAAITEDTTLYAKWIQEYSISFDLNGHGGATAPASVYTVYGKTTAPTDPEDDDYEFKGWAESAESKTAVDFDTKKFETSATLFAIWEKKPAVQMSAEDFKAAINATLNATNYSVVAEEMPFIKADGENNKIYALMGYEMYIVYDTVANKASMYSLLREGSDIMIKGSEEVPCNSFAALLDLLMFDDEMGLATSLKTLGTLTATQYEDVTFDTETGEYTYGNITVTFADGKVATFIDEGTELLSFTDYGKTSVALPSDNIFENVVFNIYENNFEKLGKLDDSIKYGLYAQDNSADNYVAATDKGFAQTIAEGTGNQEIYISFAMLKGDIEGYFELSADALGSKWDIIQFIGGGNKKFCVNMTGGEGVLKYNLATGNEAANQTAPLTEISMAKDVAIKVAYKLVKAEEGNYSLTLTIDGKDFVKDLDLGVSTMDRITLPSSGSGSRKLTIDNVIICGEKMTADDYRSVAQAKIDAVYNTMAVGESATHSINAQNIKSIYDSVKLSEITEIDRLASEVESFIRIMAQFDSDEAIVAAREAATTKLDEFKAEKEDDYTLNSVAFLERFTQAAAQIANATSVKFIEDYADTEKLLEGILTDEEVLALNLATAKADAAATLKETFNDYKNTLDLTEVTPAKLAEVEANIEAAWATAKNAVEDATEVDEVTDALSTLATSVETAIASGSDNVDAKKNAAANKLATDTDAAIAAAGLDKNAEDVQANIYNEVSGILPYWQGRIRTEAADEAQLNQLVEQATFEIYRTYAPLQLQAELAKAQAAVDEAKDVVVVNGLKLEDIPGRGTVGSKVHTAAAAITGHSSSVADYNQQILDARNAISQAQNKEDVDEQMKIIGALATSCDKAVEEIEKVIADLKVATLKVMLDGVTGFEAADVTFGGKVVLTGSEPADKLVKGWYTGKSSNDGELYDRFDFDTPIYDDITLYADAVAAINKTDNNEFVWADIKGITTDQTRLTDDDMTGSNAFLNILSSTDTDHIRWRSSADKSKNYIDEKGGALQVEFKGAGTLKLSVRSTGDSKTSAFAIKNSAGEYIAATAASVTGNLKQPINDTNIYTITGNAYLDILFEISEADTYTICQFSSVEGLSGLDGYFRMSAIEKVDNYKEELIAVDSVAIAPDTETGEWAANKTYDVSTGTLALKATLDPDNTTYKHVIWESDNKGVATVDENGVVTFIKKGTAKIKATVEVDGNSSEVTITVADSALEAKITAAKAKLDQDYPAENYQNEEWQGEIIGNQAEYAEAYDAALTAFEAATTEAELEEQVEIANRTLGAIQKTADLKLTQFNVKFYDGATEYTELAKQVADGSTVVKPVDPEKAGYKFKAWYTTADFAADTEFVFTTAITDALADEENVVSLYAKFAEAYTVNFYVDGEKVRTDVIEVVDGVVATAPTLEDKTDYTFDGYYTAADYNSDKWEFTTALTADNTDSNRVLNLYGKWVATVKATQSFMYSDMTVGSYAENAQITTGDLFTMKAAVALDVSSFDKKYTYTDSEDENNNITIQNADNKFINKKLGKKNATDGSKESDFVIITSGEKAITVTLFVSGIKYTTTGFDTTYKKVKVTYGTGDKETATPSTKQLFEAISFSLAANTSITIHIENTGSNNEDTVFVMFGIKAVEQ